MQTNDLTFETRDDFKRKVIAEEISKIILRNSKDNSPILINGNWGSGKTEFCTKLINLLNENSSEERPIKTVYIDSYKYDYIDDPLVMLTSQLIRQLENKKINIEKVKNAAIPIVKGTIRAGVNLALNAVPYGGMAKEFLDQILEAEHNCKKDIFEDYMAYDEKVQSLKTAIAEICKDNQLVMVIDELDRCIPSYSLKLLEKIKHVFDIDNLTVIISCNLKQLEASVQQSYGPSINSEQYLEKFFQHQYTLNEYTKTRTDKQSNVFMMLMSCLPYEDVAFITQSSDDRWWLEFFLQHYKCNLRDAQKIANNLKTLFELEELYDKSCNTTMIFLTILALKAPEVFAMLKYQDELSDTFIDLMTKIVNSKTDYRNDDKIRLRNYLHEHFKKLQESLTPSYYPGHLSKLSNEYKYYKIINCM